MTYRELITELCELRSLSDRKEYSELSQRLYALVDKVIESGIKLS